MNELTQRWIDSLRTMAEADALAALRQKAAELFAAEHGHAPRDSGERAMALDLFEAAVERLPATPSGNGHVGRDDLARLGRLTLAEYRRLADETEGRFSGLGSQSTQGAPRW